MQYQNSLKILCMKYRGRKKNILTVLKPVRYGKISITVYRDISLEGYGASMGNISTGWVWPPDEKLMHINVLELKATLLAPKSFAKAGHKQYRSDNTIAIHCIKKMQATH